ncbi:ABC transporter ATP-binding protein [Pseudoalteromonas sp. T1lg23B]|uniref:ABC transporter ATP-binding protein n=1 Tax=Pseudoalteromonas sp. T1lg23B TaxID=2077097 RepID=UPI000CF6B7C9|nr:ATP-binding cassette domain-containing protein [Pseudoalteromonas sp. T1lg23B]
MLKEIEFKKINKEFYTANNNNQPVQAIRNLSLSIPFGKTIALVGKSGVGKSTLLEMLAGLELPTEGQIKFLLNNGKFKAHSDQKRQTLIKLVTMVFQNYDSSLFPWQSIRETIRFAMSVKGKFCEDRYKQLLELCDLNIEKENCFPHELSGGQKQRLALARAIATKPELLVMDEPCGSVDQLTKEHLNNTFIKIKNANEVGSIFFSTHDITEAVYLADIVLVMKKCEENIVEIKTFYIDRDSDNRFDREAPYITKYVKKIRTELE